LFRFSDKLQLVASSYVQNGIRILTVFIMARFIGPIENGIYLYVVYVAGLVMALNDFAIPYSVVQMQEYPEDVVVDTGVVLTAILYTFYGLFAVLAGVFLTRHDPHHDPRYWRIGAIIGFATFISALYNVQLARLNRRLEFRAESQQNIIFAVSTAATGIIFAVLHYGAYALALQLLAGQLAANIGINLRVPLTWPKHASWTVAKRFIKLGTPVSLAIYVRAVEANITGLIIKPIGGTAGLGIWGKSIQVQLLFSQNLLVAFQRVAYPLICRGVNDAARMRELFARVTLMLMMVSLLFTAIVGVNSEAIVRVALGVDWAKAAPLLRISAWAIPAGALDMVATLLCMAVGMSKLLVRSAAINLVLFIPASLIIRHLGGGLIGLAICWTISRYLISLATLEAVTRHMHLGAGLLIKPLGALFISGVLSSATMVTARMLCHGIRLPIQLVLVGTIGLIVYVVAVWLAEPNTILDAIKMARGGGAAADDPGGPDVMIPPTADLPA
jgi:O-antigen/teichoic acid export membrane protein